MMSTATNPVLSAAPGGIDLCEDYFRFVVPIRKTCPERR